MDIKKYIRERVGFLLENQDVIDNILDKISSHGMASLSTNELEYLTQNSADNIDPTLEKTLTVGEGTTFEADEKYENYIKFVYNETENYGDEIRHVGELYFDKGVFEGAISCNGSGQYDHFDFNFVQLIDADEEGSIFDEIFQENPDLAASAEDFEIEELETFFETDVVPNLKFN